MYRFKFRLNRKKDRDRLIMVWLESLPEGKRSSTVKEVLRGYIENRNDTNIYGQEQRPPKEQGGPALNQGPEFSERDIERLVDKMF